METSRNATPPSGTSEPTQATHWTGSSKHGAFRGRRGGPWGWCGPGVLWLVGFVVVPVLLIVGTSLLTRGEYGEVQGPLTFDNYRRLAGWGELGFDPLYPKILGRTLGVAALVSLATLAAALPLAFLIAGLDARWRSWALALVVIPFWSNLLIRTYAWQILLAAEGPIPRLAAALGWLAPDTALYPSWGAVLLALFCDFLPFMVLPVYASVEKIDWSLAEAAADLGAGRMRAFREAIWPQIRPGVGAGLIVVFLPVTGQFVIPDLLGGGRTTLLGNLIQQQFGASRDWPLGAAAASVLLGLVLGALAWRGWRRGSATGGEAPVR